MDIAQHGAAVPYALIAGASAFHTQDVEEARQWGVRTFCESLHSAPGSRPAPPARVPACDVARQCGRHALDEPAALDLREPGD